MTNGQSDCNHCQAAFDHADSPDKSLSNSHGIPGGVFLQQMRPRFATRQVPIRLIRLIFANFIHRRRFPEIDVATKVAGEFAIVKQRVEEYLECGECLAPVVATPAKTVS